MTNSLITVDALATTTVTMTTREIAELTGKRHDNVARDFKHMCKEMKIAAEDFEVSYLSPQNKRLPMYSLPKDLTIILVTGYSIRMRHAIIQRMFKLEEDLAKAPVLGFAESLNAAADSESRMTSYREAMMQAIEKVEKAEAANKELIR